MGKTKTALYRLKTYLCIKTRVKKMSLKYINIDIIRLRYRAMFVTKSLIIYIDMIVNGTVLHYNK